MSATSPLLRSTVAPGRLLAATVAVVTAGAAAAVVSHDLSGGGPPRQRPPASTTSSATRLTPDVDGFPVTDASAALRQAGFRVRVRFVREVVPAYGARRQLRPGTVFRQDPVAWSPARPQSVVTLNVIAR